MKAGIFFLENFSLKEESVSCGWLGSLVVLFPTAEASEHRPTCKDGYARLRTDDGDDDDDDDDDDGRVRDIFFRVLQQFLANRSRDFKYPFVFSFGKCGFQLFAVLDLFPVVSGFMNL
jgi:hypothetical protein